MDTDIIDLKTNQPPATTPNIDLNALQSMLAQLQALQPTQPKDDAFDRTKAVVDASKEREAMMAEVREQVEFDSNFDGLIAKHKDRFGEFSSQAIRKGGEGLTGGDLNHHLKVASFKAFFSDPENLKLVAPHEAAFVQGEIGKNERLFDSKRAWTVMQSALFMAEQVDYQNQIRGTGNSTGVSATPNIDAFIEKCRARFD